MENSILRNSPLFQLRVDITVSASPEKIYSLVSDMPRTAEWSPECAGGEWASGEPAKVGAIFRGKNVRSHDVVAWAPVPRGTWYNESAVVAAEPGRTFRWEVLTDTGESQDCVWGFDIEPTEKGALLAHHYRMGTVSPGIMRFTKGLDEAGKKRFVDDWTDKLRLDMRVTVERVKAAVEG